MIAAILWIAIFVSGAPHLGEHAPTLTLDRQAMHASGFAGCNRYSGEFSQGGRRLSFRPLAMTRMMCAPEQMTVEDAYAADMGRARTYWASSDRLSLYAADGTLLLRFKRE